jgi:hypothetical protein
MIQKICFRIGANILYIQRLPQRTSDAAVTGPVGIHYDSVSDSTPKQGGQSDHTTDQARNLQYDDSIDSKQPTPAVFDPCTLAGVPTMDFRDTPDL